MKKISILFLLLVCAFPFVKADIVNHETAAKVAKNHLSVYAPSMDYNSIFALGLLLFIITLTLNIISRKLVKKYQEVYD